MSTITTRSGKGSPLTNNEVDANFTNLNTDKLESADLAGYAELTGATFTGEVEATGFNGDLTGAILFKGQAGEALTKGDPVYISGISGNKTVVSKADANDANKMPCFGIVDATVSANADCSVVTFGTLQGLDTSSFSEGDELFISDTGTLTTTAPTGESSQIQKIGKVTRSHASAGSIKVMGAGRTNAVPNLNDGQFFLGNGSNQAVSTDFTTSVLGEISAGTGIGISGSGVISNSAPDQTVSLTGAGTTTVSGTYPNFTITGSGTTYTAGTGITLTGTEFSLTDTNAKLNLTGGTLSGNLTVSYTGNSTNDAGVYVNNDASDWGIKVAKASGADYGLVIDTNGDNAIVVRNTSGANGFQVKSNGTVYLGGSEITSSSAALQVNGFQRTGTIYLHEGTSAVAGNNWPLETTSGGELRWNTNKLWHAGNDGSGSGLDADTVDGLHASSFGRFYNNAVLNTSTTTANLISELQNDYGAFNNNYVTLKCSWSYASNSNLVTGHSTIGTIELAGCLVEAWGGTYKHIRITRPTTGTGGSTICVYNDQGSSYSPAWREIWTSETDGSGSGLDADLLDGLQPKSSSGSTGANQILRSHSNNYFYHNSWINIGGAGLFSSTTNGAHFQPNTTTTYGTWRSAGSRGGYDGILFDSGGDVAIMYDSSGNGGLYRQANGRWHIYHHVGNNCLAIGSSGTSSTYEAYVHGDLYATGNITAYSDARIKENVVTIDSALEKVKSMRGVYYNKIDDPDKTKEVGFIAQEVNEVIPEAVTYAEDVDQYGVKYANITALLVESVKELSQQVKDLQAEVKELKENG